MDYSKRTMEIADYIINNNATISQTANALNIAYYTARRDVDFRLPTLDPQLFAEVKKVLSELKSVSAECNARVFKVAYYIIGNKATVLQTANALGIAYQTVHADINKRLQILNPQLFAEVKKVLSGLKPSVTECDARALKVAKYTISNDTSLTQTAKALNIEYYVVHRDIHDRLPALDPQLYTDVIAILKEVNAGRLGNLYSRTLKVADYIIDNNATIPETAKALNLNNHTVNNDIRRKLPKLNPQLFLEVQSVLAELKTESGVKKRVSEVANYIIGNNASLLQTAKIFGKSYTTVYRDIHDRLSALDPKLYATVVEILKNQGLNDAPAIKGRLNDEL